MSYNTLFQRILADMKHVKLKGEQGTWSKVDKRKRGDLTLYLMKSDQDENAPNVIVDHKGRVLMKDLYNDWYDLDII